MCIRSSRDLNLNQKNKILRHADSGWRCFSRWYIPHPPPPPRKTEYICLPPVWCMGVICSEEIRRPSIIHGAYYRTYTHTYMYNVHALILLAPSHTVDTPKRVCALLNSLQIPIYTEHANVHFLLSPFHSVGTKINFINIIPMPNYSLCKLSGKYLHTKNSPTCLCIPYPPNKSPS